MNKPLFQPGDTVRTPVGELQRVIQCDLHGCTVDNGTRGGARYDPVRLDPVPYVHVSYAYPSSPQACKGGGAGYYVTPSTFNETVLSGPHERLADAMVAVETMGATPDRWSEKLTATA
jgi:hypothetical protein